MPASKCSSVSYCCSVNHQCSEVMWMGKQPLEGGVYVKLSLLTYTSCCYGGYIWLKSQLKQSYMNPQQWSELKRPLIFWFVQRLTRSKRIACEVGTVLKRYCLGDMLTFFSYQPNSVACVSLIVLRWASSCFSQLAHYFFLVCQAACEDCRLLCKFSYRLLVDARKCLCIIIWVLAYCRH